MRVLAAEPYATPSHVAFLEGLARHSRHELVLDLLPARVWKWRMRTASVRVAERLERDGPFDLLLASDYLHVAETIGALPRALRATPAAVYLHENQLTYPLREGEARDVHFGLVHVHSILAAGRAAFNSAHHRDGFLRAAAELLAKEPDLRLGDVAEELARRSGVLPLGVDLPAGEPRPPVDAPVILWPHRFEHDKAPERLLDTLVELDRRGERFRLRLCGQRFRERPAALGELERRFADRLEGSGFLDRDGYLAALRSSDVVVSTARHEFFGLATLEAMRAGALPVLPDDLAYPELVPEDLHSLALYDRSESAGSVADALARALAIVRAGERLDERRALVRSTDRFAWETLAPRYDAWLEAAARGA